MAHVFICYDREDRDFAEVVQAKLERAGHVTVMDFDILSAGDDWQDRLDLEIRRSQALVVIMTPEARQSDYVAYEWAFALGAGVKVIPLELKQTSFSPRLHSLHRLDFTKSTRPWDTLLAEVKKAELTHPLASIEVDVAAPVAVKQAVRAIDSLDPGQRLAAVETLAQTDHPSAVDALTRALQHAVGDVRNAAACLFPDQTDPRIVPGLVAAYRQDRYKWFAETPFVSRMEAIGAAAVPNLLNGLNDAPEETRCVIIDALGYLGDASIIPALSQELLHSDADVRQCAAQALGRIGDPGAAAVLAAALNDAAASVRRAAVDSLGTLRIAAVVPDLIAILEEDNRYVRAGAARALGRIGDRSAAQALLSALDEDDTDVKVAAAAALGALGDPVAAPHLRRLLETRASSDPLTSVDGAVMVALGRLHDRESLPLIEARLIHSRGGDYGQVEQLCDHLAQWGAVGTALVIRIVQTALSSTARTLAARSLSRIPTPDAITAYKQWQRTH
jgi:HEAT repeat protein